MVSEESSLKQREGMFLQHFCMSSMLTLLLITVRDVVPFLLFSLTTSPLGMFCKQSSNSLVSVAQPRRYILAPPVLVLRVSSRIQDLEGLKKLTNLFSFDWRSDFFIIMPKSRCSNQIIRWMEIMDTDAERRIEESFYEERERHKKTSNMPKKSMDHSLLRNKKFFNESDQKESPKFSQLNEQSLHKEDSKSLSGTLKQPLSNITNIDILPRTATNKQFQQVGRDRRFRSRYSVEGNMGKPVQFSPYKRPTSRRPRHNYLSKQNIPLTNLPDFQEQLNRSSITIDKLSSLELQNKQLKARQQVYKKEIRILTEQLAKQRSANASIPLNNDNQIKQLLSKIDGLQEVTHQLKESVRTLKWQNKELEDKGKTFVKLECQIRKELAMDNQEMSFVLEALLKKFKKNESFVDSIADMRSKITGISSSNLKQLWRWLKKTVQQIHSINQFLLALKAQLKLPKEAKFQQLKMKLAKRIFS